MKTAEAELEIAKWKAKFENVRKQQGSQLTPKFRLRELHMLVLHVLLLLTWGTDNNNVAAVCVCMVIHIRCRRKSRPSRLAWRCSFWFIFEIKFDFNSGMLSV